MKKFISCLFSIIIFLISAILFNSCQDRTPISPEQLIPTNEVLFPGGIGSYWVYQDTIHMEGKTFITIDSMQIVDRTQINGLDFWVVKNNSILTFHLKQYFWSNRDTIWSAQWCQNQWYKKTLFILPPDANPLSYPYVETCRDTTLMQAQLVNEPISVPAGTFDWYIKYTVSYSRIEGFYLVPGVGMVKGYSSLNSTGGGLDIRSSLLNYFITQ